MKSRLYQYAIQDDFNGFEEELKKLRSSYDEDNYKCSHEYLREFFGSDIKNCYIEKLFKSAFSGPLYGIEPYLREWGEKVGGLNDFELFLSLEKIISKQDRYYKRWIWGVLSGAIKSKNFDFCVEAINHYGIKWQYEILDFIVLKEFSFEVFERVFKNVNDIHKRRIYTIGFISGAERNKYTKEDISKTFKMLTDNGGEDKDNLCHMLANTHHTNLLEIAIKLAPNDTSKIMKEAFLNASMTAIDYLWDKTDLVKVYNELTEENFDASWFLGEYRQMAKKYEELKILALEQKILREVGSNGTKNKTRLI